MRDISRFDKVILLLTAGFVLFTGGWFLAQRSAAQPYQVTAARNDREEPQETERDLPPSGGGRTAFCPGRRSISIPRTSMICGACPALGRSGPRTL